MKRATKLRIVIAVAFVVVALGLYMLNLIVTRPDLQLKPGEEKRIDKWTSLDQYVFVNKKIYKDLSYTLYRVDENGSEEVIDIPMENFETSSPYGTNEEYLSTLIYVDSNDYLIVKNVSNKTITLSLELRP